ncbi:hypothetical protein BY996DRAFT_6415535 [Phakopsora pachyrhizi]|nr:hypothetical protein BY996DRAFT_6415535 [Phakopsora pachyrhizi]
MARRAILNVTTEQAQQNLILERTKNWISGGLYSEDAYSYLDCSKYSSSQKPQRLPSNFQKIVAKYQNDFVSSNQEPVLCMIHKCFSMCTKGENHAEAYVGLLQTGDCICLSLTSDKKPVALNALCSSFDQEKIRSFPYIFKILLQKGINLEAFKPSCNFNKKLESSFLSGNSKISSTVSKVAFHSNHYSKSLLSYSIYGTKVNNLIKKFLKSDFKPANSNAESNSSLRFSAPEASEESNLSFLPALLGSISGFPNPSFLSPETFQSFSTLPKSSTAVASPTGMVALSDTSVSYYETLSTVAYATSSNSFPQGSGPQPRLNKSADPTVVNQQLTLIGIALACLVAFLTAVAILLHLNRLSKARKRALIDAMESTLKSQRHIPEGSRKACSRGSRDLESGSFKMIYPDQTAQYPKATELRDWTFPSTTRRSINLVSTAMLPKEVQMSWVGVGKEVSSSTSRVDNSGFHRSVKVDKVNSDEEIGEAKNRGKTNGVNSQESLLNNCTEYEKGQPVKTFSESFSSTRALDSNTLKNQLKDEFQEEEEQVKLASPTLSSISRRRPMTSYTPSRKSSLPLRSLAPPAYSHRASPRRSWVFGDKISLKLINSISNAALDRESRPIPVRRLTKSFGIGSDSEMEDEVNDEDSQQAGQSENKRKIVSNSLKYNNTCLGNQNSALRMNNSMMAAIHLKEFRKVKHNSMGSNSFASYRPPIPLIPGRKESKSFSSYSINEVSHPISDSSLFRNKYHQRHTMFSSVQYGPPSTSFAKISRPSPFVKASICVNNDKNTSEIDFNSAGGRLKNKNVIRGHCYSNSAPSIEFLKGLVEEKLDGKELKVKLSVTNPDPDCSAIEYLIKAEPTNFLKNSLPFPKNHSQSFGAERLESFSNLQHCNHSQESVNLMSSFTKNLKNRARSRSEIQPGSNIHSPGRSYEAKRSGGLGNHLKWLDLSLRGDEEAKKSNLPSSPLALSTSKDSGEKRKKNLIFGQSFRVTNNTARSPAKIKQKLHPIYNFPVSNPRAFYQNSLLTDFGTTPNSLSSSSKRSSLTNGNSVSVSKSSNYPISFKSAISEKKLYHHHRTLINGNFFDKALTSSPNNSISSFPIGGIFEFKDSGGVYAYEKYRALRLGKNGAAYHDAELSNEGNEDEREVRWESRLNSSGSFSAEPKYFENKRELRWKYV